MADQISKLHTEMTVGTTQFSAGMAKASGDLGSLNNALKGTGDNLGRLANRMDKGDIVNGFNNISQALGTASGMGDKFGNFMSGFALSAATGGIAGAAFGGAIGLINLGLEAYNENAAKAAKRNEELAASFGRASAMVSEFNRTDRARAGGRGKSWQDELAEIDESIISRREALALKPKVYDKNRGVFTQAEDFEFDALVRRRTDIEARIAGIAPGSDAFKGRFDDAGKFRRDEKPGRDFDVQETLKDAITLFGEEIAGPNIGVEIKDAAKRTAEAAWLNPAIIAGSQADVEMQARLAAQGGDTVEEQQVQKLDKIVDVLMDIREQGSESGSLSGTDKL